MSQHGHVQVGVVVDANFALSVIETVKPSRILRNRSMRGHRQRQKQCVQPRIIESLADVTASRENDSSFFRGNRGELGGHGFSLFLSHAASQHDDVANSSR